MSMAAIRMGGGPIWTGEGFYYNGPAPLYIMPGSPRRYDLLRTRLDRFTRMLHGVERGDVRAIHRTRVATRRLREVLPILQLDATLARKLGRRLKRVTERLGAVRELDVLMLHIDEIARRPQIRPQGRAVDDRGAWAERGRRRGSG